MGGQQRAEAAAGLAGEQDASLNAEMTGGCSQARGPPDSSAGASRAAALTAGAVAGTFASVPLGKMVTAKAVSAGGGAWRRPQRCPAADS